MNERYFDPFIETLGRNALEEFQMHRFRMMLEEILSGNGFYQRKLYDAGVRKAGDIKRLEDLYKLPFTTKQELTLDQIGNAPYGTNLTYPRDRYTKIHQTSGTTGEPLQCLDTDESWEWWARCWATVYRAVGVTPRDRIFFAFSFGPFIGFWSAYEGAKHVGGLAVPGGGMSSLQRARAILTHDITVVVCTPTYALHLAEVAEEEGLDIAGSAVHTTIHAGEPGASLPGTRSRIEKAWGARAFDHAGATEVGAWGFESQAQNGVFVHEGEFIFEVIDPDTGDHAEEGELIITNLGRVGFPVIRYRSGDRVRIAEGPSADGRTFRRLDGGVIGRVDDAMTVRGINVFPSAIENVVRRFSEIGEFAVDVYRRDELDELELKIEVSGAEPDMVAAALQGEIRDSIGIRSTVSAVPHGTLPRFDLKARRFKDHRSRD